MLLITLILLPSYIPGTNDIDTLYLMFLVCTTATCIFNSRYQTHNTLYSNSLHLLETYLPNTKKLALDAVDANLLGGSDILMTIFAV
jgi:hypothetical protein